MTQFLLIRHGRTAWNQQGRYQGHADPPLDASGRAQARRLATAFADMRLNAIYSSDLQRAVATAAPLSRQSDLPVQTDARLRELDFGQWDGQRVEELMQSQLPELERWWSDPISTAPPDGETVAQLWARITAVLDEIALRHTHGVVALVTHGGPLRLITAQLETGHLHPPGQVSIRNGGWLLVPDLPQALNRKVVSGV